MYNLNTESDIDNQEGYEIPLLSSEVIYIYRQEHIYTIKEILLYYIKKGR
jgi:hypothetical protein